VHAINTLPLCAAKSEAVMPTKGIKDIYLSVPLNEIMAYPEFVLVGIRMECCMETE